MVRNLGTLSRLEIHSFGDAFKDAICATVYFRVLSEDKSIVNLCASLLLCKLVCSILDNFKFSQVSIHLWSDSQVVLCWIVYEPYLWQVLMASS